MNGVPTSDKRRAIATAALMESDQDGEALGAARAFCRILGKHGLTPAKLVEAALSADEVEVICPGPRRPGSPIVNRPPDPVTPWSSNKRKAMMCRAYRQHLTAWEQGFIDSIVDLSRLSEKQEARLKAIYAKVERLTR